MKAYKLLSNEEKQEVTITTLSHLTYGIKSDLWYDVTVKYLRLVAAVSLWPYAQEWEGRYQVVQEIYESGPECRSPFKARACYTR